MLAAFTAPERDEDNSSEASTRTPELHDQRLQGSAPPRYGAAPGCMTNGSRVLLRHATDLVAFFRGSDGERGQVTFAVSGWC